MPKSHSTKLIAGAHTSIAGGLPKAIEHAVAIGGDALQIFARNPRGWMERRLEADEVRAFREAREKASLWPLAIHAVYLINLAATDPVILERSRAAFRQELKRGLEIGADYLVVHPGNPKSAPAEIGLQTAIESIRAAARSLRLEKSGLTILIENTAGQGSSIGCTFDQVADIVAALDDLPIGVCLDTAHTLASGYDIASKKGFESTLREIRRTFGFKRLKLIHCNDSKAPLGSRVDRHEHIGLGHIGEEGFRRILQNPRLRRLPFILETPNDKTRDDAANLCVLRELGTA